MHRQLRTIVCVPALLVAACTGPIKTETHPIDAEATSLRVTNQTGDIVIRQAEDEPPGIVATIEGKRTRVRSDLTDGHQHVSVDCAPAAVYCSVDFEIYLPPGIAVELASESGNVTVGAMDLLTARVESGSGDVDLEDVTAQRLDLESGSGNVRVVDVGATEVHAQSGSGNVNLQLVGSNASVDAHSGSGDVRVALPEGDYDVTVSSGSGDARVIGISSQAGASSSVVATSDSGDVEVRAE